MLLWVFPRMHTTHIPHLEHKVHFSATVLGMIGIENGTETMMKGVSFPNLNNARTAVTKPIPYLVVDVH